MESDWYTVGTAIALSAIGFYAYMALRKPRPISTEINFEEQSVLCDVSVQQFR
jgi:hypothetical protein